VLITPNRLMITDSASRTENRSRTWSRLLPWPHVARAVMVLGLRPI